MPQDRVAAVDGSALFQLCFWQLLSMPWDGPIVAAAVAVNDSAMAQLCFRQLLSML
jgi:hypothetical protein